MTVDDFLTHTVELRRRGDSQTAIAKIKNLGCPPHCECFRVKLGYSWIDDTDDPDYACDWFDLDSAGYGTWRIGRWYIPRATQRHLIGLMKTIPPTCCDMCKEPKPLIFSSVSNGEICMECGELLRAAAERLKGQGNVEEPV